MVSSPTDDLEEENEPIEVEAHIAENLPPIIIDKSTETLPNETPPTARRKVKSKYAKDCNLLSKGIDKDVEDLPAFLKGVRYGDLAEYSSLKANHQGTGLVDHKLKKPLELFRDLVRWPASPGEDHKKMMNWLRAQYRENYRRYENLRKIYDQESDKDKDFEAWCKYYAAKAAAGFIRSYHSIENLVTALQQTPIVEKREEVDEEIPVAPTLVGRLWDGLKSYL